MFSNNSPKNIPSVKKALYAFLLGLGSVGIVAITLTTIIGTRLFRQAINTLDKILTNQTGYRRTRRVTETLRKQ